MNSAIVPDFKYCSSCKAVLFFPKYQNEDYYFYCSFCGVWINWRKSTCLEKSKIVFNNFERLFLLFIQNKSISNAVSTFENLYFGSKLNKNTIRKYFSLFNQIAFDYYQQQRNIILLSGEVEMDETLVFKTKKTKAKRHRKYNIPVMWLVGMIERNTKRFIIVPVETRDESALISIILKFVRCGSTIYTDCHSVYVNNRRIPKESKLIEYGYNHHFVDHSVEFVSKEFEHIHTNTIERLWRSIKMDLKNKKITIGSLKAISRFYFHKTLDKSNQI